MKEASNSVKYKGYRKYRIADCKQEKASKSESALLIIMGSHTQRWAPVSSLHSMYATELITDNSNTYGIFIFICALVPKCWNKLWNKQNTVCLNQFRECAMT